MRLHRFFTQMLLATAVLSVACMPCLAITPEEYYTQQKQLLLTDLSAGGFLDKGMLVERVRENGVDRHDGIGDAAWRTGLGAICFALEGDRANTLAFLKSLNDNGWGDDGPIRHPDWYAEESAKLRATGAAEDEIANTLKVKRYSRDQFIPQMAACYFAWKTGDHETKQQATKLLNRYIDLLLKNHFRFGPNSTAYATAPLQHVLRRVAIKMGARSDWSLDVSAQVRGIHEDFVTRLESTERERILGDAETKLAEIRILGQAIPKRIREDVLASLERELKKLDLSGLSDEGILANVFNSLDGLPEPLADTLASTLGLDTLVVSKEAAVAKAHQWLIERDAERIEAAGDSVDSFYGVHLLFWEILLLVECGTENMDGILQATEQLWTATRKHNMVLFALLFKERSAEARAQIAHALDLATWKGDWERSNYIWERHVASQRRACESWDGSRRYPRIDFMLLFNLEKRF